MKPFVITISSNYNDVKPPQDLFEILARKLIVIPRDTMMVQGQRKSLDGGTQNASTRSSWSQWSMRNWNTESYKKRIMWVDREKNSKTIIEECGMTVSKDDPRKSRR